MESSSAHLNFTKKWERNGGVCSDAKRAVKHKHSSSVPVLSRECRLCNAKKSLDGLCSLLRLSGFPLGQRAGARLLDGGGLPCLRQEALVTALSTDHRLMGSRARWLYWVS